MEGNENFDIACFCVKSGNGNAWLIKNRNLKTIEDTRCMIFYFHLGNHVAFVHIARCITTHHEHYILSSIRYFNWIVDEWKTNLMSLAILFHLLCAQHVSDINIFIFRSLRLCWWITTSVVLFSVRCVLELLLRLVFGGVRFAGWSTRRPMW